MKNYPSHYLNTYSTSSLYQERKVIRKILNEEEDNKIFNEFINNLHNSPDKSCVWTKNDWDFWYLYKSQSRLMVKCHRNKHNLCKNRCNLCICDCHKGVTQS